MADLWDLAPRADKPAASVWDAAPVLGGTPVSGRQAQSIYEAVVAGLQSSATGLALRGKLPEQQLDGEAPWYYRAASAAGNVVADLPLSVVGAVAGGAAGTSVAGPLGTLVGAGAGSFAVPMALRDALVEAYSGNHATSWEGVWEITKAALKGGGKGAFIGGLTAGAGSVAARGVGAAIAPGIGTAMTVKGAERVIGATAIGTELATLTTASAAIEGHMPTWQDFMDNAILLGGAKAAMHVAQGLRNIYAETGRTPEQVLVDAQKNPALKAEILSRADGGQTYWHGSPRQFEALDPTAPSTTGGGLRSHGVFMAPDRKTGERYAADFSADRKGYLYELEFTPQKPLVMTAAEFEKLQTLVSEIDRGQKLTESKSISLELLLKSKGLPFDESTHPIAAIKAAGHDSIIKEAGRGGAEAEVLAFDHKAVRVKARYRDGAAEHIAAPLPTIPDAYRGLALEQRVQAAIDKDARPDAIRRVLSGEKEWTPVGEGALRDPVKYEYVTDRETATGVMRAVSEMYQAEIAQQTRGVVPNKQTALEALKQIANGEVLERSVGEASSAADIYARAHMLRGATNHAVAELRKIADIPEGELTPVAKMQALAAIERVAMLQAEFSGAAAEAGRALQVFRAIKRDPSYLGEAETIIKLAERKGSLQDIARFVENMKDPAQVAEFLQQHAKATTFEKVMEAWKVGILSGPQTHLANILGNLTKYVVEVPESVLSASIEATSRAAKGDPMTMAQWKARAFAPIYGVQFGAKDALHVAAEVWKGQGESLEKGDIYRTAIEGRKGEIIRLPFKALQVEDALFRTMAERAEAYKLATDRAVKEGFHPDSAEFRQKVVQYTQTPEFGLADAAAAAITKQIQNAGAEAVFAQRLGPFLETVQGAIAKHAPAMQIVLPFVRTPANLVSWAVQHVPGLNLASGRWREDFAAGGERQARAIARVVIGAGITSTALALTQDEIVTGAGMFDKEQGNAKRAAGWQPYSIKIGDTYYSYQRIEPVAKVIGLAADLIELGRATKDTDDYGKIAAMTVLLFSNATISTTYLSGLSNVIQAATDPARRGEPLLEQYASSLVPKIVGQVTTMADPYKREVDGVLDSIQSQLPYFREKLLPKRDVWGEPSANERWFSVMPVATSQQSQDKVRTEAARLQLAIEDVPRFVTERGPFKPGDRRVELTGEQRDIFRQVSGKNAMTILAPIVNADDWNRIPDYAKAAIYKKVIEGTRKQGQLAALPPDDAARVQLREKIVNEIIRQQQAVEK